MALARNSFTGEKRRGNADLVSTGLDVIIGQGNVGNVGFKVKLAKGPNVIILGGGK